MMEGMSFAPFPVAGRRVLLVAQGCFTPMDAKTAVCFLRYRTREVVGVLDGSRAGLSVEEAVGFGGGIPIVGSMEDALALEPDIALVGVAPRGGGLTPEFRDLVKSFVAEGIDVMSGLHVFLDDDPEIRALREESGSRIWDVRRVGSVTGISTGRGCSTGATTVLVAGTDCNVGKMTCAFELLEGAKRRGAKAALAATGQTGIMIRERGIAVDRVVSDFLGGAVENLVNYEGEGMDVVFVEGQGSIIHPAYAGVALGLMFGAMPDCVILVHEAGRKKLRGYEVPIPPLGRMVELHRSLFEPLKRVEVAGIALNTLSLEAREAERAVEAAREETGLPVTDPVRFGVDPLLDAVL